MNIHNLKRLLAICLALLLAASALAVAEDELTFDVEPATEAERMPEEFDALNLLGDFDAPEQPTPTPGPASTPEPENVASKKAPATEDLTAKKTPGTEDAESPAKNAIPTKLTLGVKEKYTVNTSGLSGKVTFKSSRTTVATVSAKGVITAKKAGTAKITVTPKGGKKTTIAVTVKKAPAKVTLNKTKATLKAGKTLQLKATLPAGTASNKLTWSSNKTGVAKVSANGKVTAVAPGTATITVKTFNGKKATCKVTVKAGSTIALEDSSVSLFQGSTYKLKVTYTNNGTLRCTNHDTDIARCTWDSGWYGDVTYLYITGLNSGSTTLTFTDLATGYAVNLKVTVKKTFSLDRTSVSVAAGQMAAVSMTYYGDEGSIWCDCDNDAVIRYNWSGSWNGNATSLYITGVSAGIATIKIFDDAMEALGIYETISVQVTGSTVTTPTPTPVVTATPTPLPVVTPTPSAGPSDSTVTYRALLIGQEYFSWETELCTRNRGDVRLMTNMLNSVTGLYGGKFSITSRYDQTRSGVLSAIKSAFAGADSNDVSLFFIATHGVADSNGYDAGALAMSPNGTLTLPDLANALNAVPGKMIVLLESCGSGAAVYSNGKSANDPAKEFDQAVVDAFSAVDSPMKVEVQPGGMASNGLVKNTGEFRLENKFYVLTAAQHLEVSYGWEYPYYCNVFTDWLADGIATSGSMPADTDGNRQTTLNELYSYIVKRQNASDTPQHAQVYPANSSFVLFAR